MRRHDVGCNQDLVFLADQGAEFGRTTRVFDPIGIFPHRGTLCGPVGDVLVGPDVDVGIDVADFGGRPDDRLAKMAGLRLPAVLLIEIEVLLDRAGLARVGAHVEDHGTLPPVYGMMGTAEFSGASFVSENPELFPRLTRTHSGFDGFFDLALRPGLFDGLRDDIPFRLARND